MHPTRRRAKLRHPVKVLPPNKSHTFPPRAATFISSSERGTELPAKRDLRPWQASLAVTVLIANFAAAQAKPDTRFVLVEGKGQAVCEASLKRLNQGSYAEHPACERPGGERAAGFARLPRQPLSAEEVRPFWASMRSFLIDGDPDQWRRHEAWLKERGMPPRFGDRDAQLEAV